MDECPKLKPTDKFPSKHWWFFLLGENKSGAAELQIENYNLQAATTFICNKN